MYREETKSWRIVTLSDISLNFAIFTGCLYGLINGDGVNRSMLWPPKY